MKTPSFDFIKRHYQNAVIVSSAYFQDAFDITEYDFESLYENKGCIYIIHKTKKDYVKSLFDPGEGLAQKI